MKIIKDIFLISFLFFLGALNAIDFGDSIAVFQSISVDTPFPVTLYAESGMGDRLDFNAKVLSGRIVRFRSKRIEGKPFVKINFINGMYRLVANGTDGDDPATHFMIQQYTNDDGKVYIGFRSCLPALLGQGVVVGWQGTGEVFATSAVIGNSNQKWAQWELFSDPNAAENVWLRHVETQGWLEAGPQFSRIRFEADPLVKSKLKDDYEGKEWCQPYVNMTSVPDGALRIGTAVRGAAATNASAFSIEVVSNPEILDNFKPFLGGMGFALAAHGKHVSLVGGKGEAYYAGLDDKAWKRLSQQSQNGSVGFLKMVAVGTDKVLFGINSKGDTFLYDHARNIWIQETVPPLLYIACSSANNVWAISQDKKIMQRLTSGWTQAQDLPNALPVALSVDVDGNVWAIGDDQTLYLRQDGQWTSPSLNTKAIAVSAADAKNVLVLTPDYQLKKLVPGKDFQNWQTLNGKAASIAITTDSTVLILGGDVSDDGARVLRGNIFQDSELEPKNSFDLTPYRWPVRANGIDIPGNSSVELGRYGFEVKTGAGTFKGLSFTRTPEIRGYSYSKPDKDFMRGSLLSLGSLWGRGYAWLEKSLATPGSATVVFRACTKAEGDLHIVLGEKVGADCLYRIVVGGDGNKVSAILKSGEKVLENPVSIERDLRAATMPGNFELYWVSIDNGLIMLGKGMPGENIIMARRDQNPPRASNGQSLIRNVGFSSFKSIDPIAVDITEVVTMPALSFMPSSRIFYEDQNTYSLSQSNQSTWLEKTARTAEEGGVVFTVQGKGVLRLRVAEEALDTIDQFNGYEVLLSSRGPVVSQIRRNKNSKNTLVFENKLYGALFNSAQPTQYWMSWKRGKVFVGHGDFGDNPFMVWHDPQSTKEAMPIKKIGFAALEGEINISNVKITGPVTLGFPDSSISYDKSYDNFKMPTSIVLVEPIRLQMAQIGSSLQVIDKLQGKSFNLASVAGAGKTIPYRLTLQSDGSAVMDQLNAGKDSKQLIATEAGAKILAATAQTIAFMAPGYSLGGPIGLAAGLALGAAGIGMSAAGAKLQASVDYARSRDTEYVFQEEFTKLRPSGSEVTSAMQESLSRARAEFDKSDILGVTDPAEYLALIKIYQNVLTYANNAYVGGNEEIKTRLFQGLNSLIAGYDDQSIAVDNPLLTLFSVAYNNMYLIDMSNPDDKGVRETWGLFMSQIMERLFTEKNMTEDEKGFVLQGLYGQYLWLPVNLPTPGRGYIEFEAKGLSDIMIAIGPKDIINVRNTDTPLYEIALGAVGNKKVVIRERSLAQSPLAVYTGAELKKNFLTSRAGFKSALAPDGMASPREFSKYTINIEDGEIRIWQNKEGKSFGENDDAGDALLVFKDAYPEINDQFVAVGLSCWNTPVTFRNIDISTCLSDTPEESEPVEDEDVTSLDEKEVDDVLTAEDEEEGEDDVVEIEEDDLQELEAAGEIEQDTVQELPQNLASSTLLKGRTPAAKVNQRVSGQKTSQEQIAENRAKNAAIKDEEESDEQVQGPRHMGRGMMLQ